MSLPLLPLELETADADPSLSIPELGASLPRPLDSLLGSLRDVSLFSCLVVLILYGIVPPRALWGIVDGSGVPNRMWVNTVGGVTVAAVVHAADAAAAVTPVGVCPLLSIGRFAGLVWRSTRPVSSPIIYSSIASFRNMVSGLMTSSNCPVCLAWVET